MGRYVEIRITYKETPNGDNKVFTFPYPKSWGRMSAQDRKDWAVGVLKAFNAQWIYVQVSDGT